MTHQRSTMEGLLLKSLQTKMILAFSVLFLCSSVLLIFFIYQSSTKFVVMSVSNQAKAIAEQAAKAIDVEKYKTISPETGENDYYYELRSTLNNIRKMNNLKYLYTMGRKSTEKGYEYYYVVDGLPLDSKEAAKLGEVETEIEGYPIIVQAFETKKTQVGEFSYVEKYGALVSAYVPITDHSGKLIGIVGADFDATDIYKMMKQNRIKIILLTTGIMLLVTIFVYLLARYLVRPLKQLTKTVHELRKGNFDVALETNRSDEIGELTNAFDYMVRELKSMISGVSTTSIDLHHSAEQLAHSTQEAATRIEKVSREIDELASETMQQQTYIKQTSTTISEMSKALQSISASLDEAVHASQHVSQLSQIGKTKMEDATFQMNKIAEKQNISVNIIQELGEKSKKINEVVALISQIAEQTNLLALNAAIEAARAGEHGKGFAVVSEEVRKLAEQSHQATKTIALLIEEILAKMESAIEAINDSTKEVTSGTIVLSDTGKSFYEIIEAITAVSAQIKTITAATEELTSGSGQVVQMIQEVSHIAERSSNTMSEFATEMHHQSAMTQELTASSEELHALSEKLHELVKHLHK